ncbi:hypothetical protein [Paenibacillus sp.]|uniref:hypothetical protein n=1 Tax=Paenibacillus sp. TaxID=58172 RepID=UPI002D248A38|nr:hypothetical protein [Paenibacillus sp.]HZG55841.1 hypothetical protein [Paenibacillus sp.]
MSISAAVGGGAAVNAVEVQADAAHRSSGLVGVLAGVLRKVQILSIWRRASSERRRTRSERGPMRHTDQPAAAAFCLECCVRSKF